MPFNDNEYQEILQHVRRVLREAGFGAVDERILAALRGSEGPFYDLVFYLKHLIDEVSLGSDVQLGTVLRRFRRIVETESGHPVEGIRVALTPEEMRRYETEVIDFSPDPELQEVAADLGHLLEELYADRQRPSDNEANE